MRLDEVVMKSVVIFIDLPEQLKKFFVIAADFSAVELADGKFAGKQVADFYFSDKCEVFDRRIPFGCYAALLRSFWGQRKPLPVSLYKSLRHFFT